MAASGVGAQVNVASYALASPSLDATIATSAPMAQNVFMPAIFAAPALLAPSPNPEPQGVQGVFENYSWQAYVGYTFLRFYELPNTTENQNGFNASVVWFYRDWIGFDGEFMAAYGTQSSASSWSLFGGGGPRLRWAAGRGLEVFGHALIGVAHFTPQTPYGGEGAFAYEVGGGVDLNPRHQRFAYRIEGDMLGTHYFSTFRTVRKYPQASSSNSSF